MTAIRAHEAATFLVGCVIAGALFSIALALWKLAAAVQMLAWDLKP